MTDGIGVGASRQVALAEDEEEDGEYAGHSCREILRGRDPIWDASRLDLGLRAGDPLPHGASCTRKARAISGMVRPPTMRSVSATRTSIASAG